MNGHLNFGLIDVLIWRVNSPFINLQSWLRIASTAQAIPSFLQPHAHAPPLHCQDAAGAGLHAPF